MKWALLAVAAVLVAGCADPVEYQINGAFSGTHSQVDIQELVAKAESLGGDIVIMESFPEQYRATFETEDACDAFHNFVHQKAYIDQTFDNHCQIV